jgi:fatty acid amide hydrolase 2
MNPLLTKSATELARLIRDREATSVAVVEAHITRTVEVNPRINALVADRFAGARDEAERADDDVRQKRALGPLHGVPCTIKESFALTGMPNTGGLFARVGHIASSDAPTVARLRAAGAIPLGVTNLSELCMWMESSNCVYGRTSSAFDATRTAGGSSGGEGAIVGAGGAPFGLAADVGGSIRMPAYFNGVFGHKPSSGLVPNTGQFPTSTGGALRFLSTGPIARRAEDLLPLLRILAGPDGVDPACEARTLGDPDEVDVRDLVVLDVPDNGRLSVSRDVRRAQERCAALLARRGAKVRVERIDALRHSAEIWGAMLGSAEEVTFRELMANGAPFSPGLELLRWTVGRSHHTLPALALALIEGVTKLRPADTARFVAMGRALRRELDGLLDERAVLLFPTYPTVAPKHGAALLFPVKWMYAAIFNVMELPVTAVPLGLDAHGVPLGVQVVGAHGCDHVTIAVAKAIERETGGWVPPDD